MPLIEVLTIIAGSKALTLSIDAVKAVTAGVSAGKGIGQGIEAARRRWSSDRNRRALADCAKSYNPSEIAYATEHYVEPNCQTVDPSGAEDFRQMAILDQTAFKVLDKFVFKDPMYRHYIVLADSGMGKTSLLLNYLARHVRKKSHGVSSLVLIPLNNGDSDSQIALIAKSTRSTTTLFLDALDEDMQAVEDTAKRISELVELTKDFQKILITCRTQFFRHEEEVPRETGIVRVGATPLGIAGQYQFGKVYLSPFSDEQVETYINDVFPFWSPRNRRAARELVVQVADLSLRPMLLAHLPVLIKSGQNLKYSSQVFDALVEGWLAREEDRVKKTNVNALRQFSELVALDIYSRAAERGEEKITVEELNRMVAEWGLPLEEWQARGRSLLNHDSAGKLKFAHRSIMEFLLIKQFIRDPEKFPRLRWTDRMKRTCWEMLTIENIKGRVIDLAKADLSEFYRSRPSYISVVGQIRSLETQLQSDLLAGRSAQTTPAKTIFAEVPQVFQHLGAQSVPSEHSFILEKSKLRVLIRDRGVEICRDISMETSPDSSDHLFVASVWNWQSLHDLIVDTGSVAGMQLSVTLDHTTGLAWHESGTQEGVSFEFAGFYLTILDFLRVGGVAGWRLPTLVEALSICGEWGKFEGKQGWIWTSSTNPKTGARLAVSLKPNSRGKVLDVGSEQEEFESAVYPFARAVCSLFPISA